MGDYVAGLQISRGHRRQVVYSQVTTKERLTHMKKVANFASFFVYTRTPPKTQKSIKVSIFSFYFRQTK